MKKNVLELVGLTTEDITRELYFYSDLESQLRYIENIYLSLDEIIDELDIVEKKLDDFVEDKLEKRIKEVKDFDMREKQIEFLDENKIDFKHQMSEYIFKYFSIYGVQKTFIETSVELYNLIGTIVTFSGKLELLYTKIQLLSNFRLNQTENTVTRITKKVTPDKILRDHVLKFIAEYGERIILKKERKLNTEQKLEVKKYCAENDLNYGSFRKRLRDFGYKSYDYIRNNLVDDEAYGHVIGNMDF